MTTLNIVAAIGLGLAGALAHEVTHWLVWRLGGRDPEFRLIELEVRPRAGPNHTTPLDRAAAIAPYAVAILALPLCLSLRWWPLWVAWVMLVQIPSSADVRTALGRTEWAGLQ
jgi:hypothetical protein